MGIIEDNLHPKVLKNKLFVSAVDWLIDHKKVENQKELAAVTKIQEPTLSNIRNDKKIVSDKTIRKLIESFPGLFNPDYFRGQSVCMLMQDLMEEKAKTESPKNVPSDIGDVMELYAQRIRLVDDLRQSLKEELAEVRAIKEDMQTAVNDFRDATYRLTQALRSLNEQRPPSIGIAADDGDY